MYANFEKIMTRLNSYRKWQQESDPEKPAPTRYRRTVFCEKNTIFSKKCVNFPTYNGNCTRAANLGASLRRPNWPCPESLLLFYKLFSKIDANRAPDAISA